jgi:mycofactocin precursor
MRPGDDHPKIGVPMSLTIPADAVGAGTARDHAGTPVVQPEQPEPGAAAAGADTLVEEDLLVEDVSIDGMCGVY